MPEMSMLPELEAPARPTYFDPQAPDHQVTVTDLFGPHFRDGVVELDYLLRTQNMKQLYKRDFVYISRMLYSVERYRKVSIVDQTKIDASEAIVTRKIDSVRKLLNSQLKQATALIEANAQVAHRISYPRAERYRAPLISPYAREFMELLVTCDEAASKLEAAYLLGLIEREKRSAVLMQMRKAIRTIAPTARQIRVELAKYMRRLLTEAKGEERSSIEGMISQEAQSLTVEGQNDSEVLGSVSEERALQALAASVAADSKHGTDDAREITPPSPDLSRAAPVVSAAS